MKVLYIAGGGRSGSTILERILGRIDGFVSTGELRQIWSFGFLRNGQCGCQAPFKECRWWNSVLTEAFGGADQVDAGEMMRFQMMLPGPLNFLRLILLGESSSLRRGWREHLRNLELLYQAIYSTAGRRVLIDSSKHPMYGFLLRLIPSIELYAVHLIRDPRAVAYSLLRNQLWLPYHPMRNAMRWNLFNIATELILKRHHGRYLMLRYEDFIQQPEEAVRHILGFVQEQSLLRSFVSADEVNLGIDHTVYGNPNRFQTGIVRLRLDDEWMLRMNPRDQRLIAFLTWFLLRRYKYRPRIHP